MFHVHFAAGGDAWNVVDEHQGLTFSGTKQQVEDWLDFQENLRRQESAASERSHRHPVDVVLKAVQRYLTTLGRLLKIRLVTHH